jgi:hypothetical protein
MAVAISHFAMVVASVSYGADAGKDSSLTDSRNEKGAAAVATPPAPSATPQLSVSPPELTELLSQKEELRRQLSLSQGT